MKYFFLFALIAFSFSSCALKKAQLTKSATVIFKTPVMKFYDKGFINKYPLYTNLQIYNIGNIVLNLDVYKTQVCQSTFKCISSKEFNKKYLSYKYDDTFLYDLLKQEKIYFKDKPNNILIKVKYDKI